MLYETKFLLALVTTWLIEIPVLVALIRFVFRDRDQKISRIIFAGALCTALTLPRPGFVLPPFVDAAYYTLIGKSTGRDCGSGYPQPGAGVECETIHGMFIRHECGIVSSWVDSLVETPVVVEQSRNAG